MIAKKRGYKVFDTFRQFLTLFDNFDTFRQDFHMSFRKPLFDVKNTTQKYKQFCNSC